jgi:hypothetical protein
MKPIIFEASVIRDDDSLTVWITASVSPRIVLDALDEYWERDTATIDDCTDEQGEFVTLTREEEHEFEQKAIGEYYALLNEKKEARAEALNDSMYR